MRPGWSTVSLDTASGSTFIPATASSRPSRSRAWWVRCLGWAPVAAPDCSPSLLRRSDLGAVLPSSSPSLLRRSDLGAVLLPPSSVPVHGGGLKDRAEA